MIFWCFCKVMFIVGIQNLLWQSPHRCISVVAVIAISSSLRFKFRLQHTCPPIVLLVVTYTIPQAANFICPLQPPLTNVSTHCTTLSSCVHRLNNGTNNYSQCSGQSRWERLWLQRCIWMARRSTFHMTNLFHTRLLSSSDCLKIIVNRLIIFIGNVRIDIIHSTLLLIFLPLILFNRPVLPTHSLHIPSFKITTIATPSRSCSVKEDFMSLMIRFTKARFTQHARGICLTCATIPSNIATTEYIPTTFPRCMSMR